MYWNISNSCILCRFSWKFCTYCTISTRALYYVTLRKPFIIHWSSVLAYRWSSFKIVWRQWFYVAATFTFVWCKRNSGADDNIIQGLLVPACYFHHEIIDNLIILWIQVVRTWNSNYIKLQSEWLCFVAHRFWYRSTK